VKLDFVRRLAVPLLVSLGAAGLSACAQQPSGPTGLPSGNAASPYQSSYIYNADSDGSPASKVRNASQSDPLARSLMADQTVGFGADQQLVFTYRQQFDCVVGPHSDVNSIGKEADVAPQQFASPECAIGFTSRLSPSGHATTQTDPLYVLVPFFETNKKTGAFTKDLGKALKKLFGFVPDAFKPDPGVAVQCPTPKDMPATCTMHPLQLNLGPVLAELALVPKGTNLYVPIVNHDHLLPDSTINQSEEWWQVIVVLVSDPKAWPSADGSTGITSVAKLRTAQKNKQASADVPSNFFLYFNSKAMGKADARMSKMRM
jgi:hypothetical protein